MADLAVTSYEKMQGVFFITPIGRIDINTYPVLEKKVDQLLQNAPKIIVIDMQDVDYVSSAGVRVVLKTQKAMKKCDGKFVITNFQPQVKKVFEIINALPSQQIFSSIEELDLYLDRVQKNELL